MLDDLKFGDVIGWVLDGNAVRWMLVSPVNRVVWKAVWMVPPEEDHGSRWTLGQVKNIGVNEGTVVVSDQI